MTFPDQTILPGTPSLDSLRWPRVLSIYCSELARCLTNRLDSEQNSVNVTLLFTVTPSRLSPAAARDVSSIASRRAASWTGAARPPLITAQNQEHAVAMRWHRLCYPCEGFERCQFDRMALQGSRYGGVRRTRRDRGRDTAGYLRNCGGRGGGKPGGRLHPAWVLRKRAAVATGLNGSE
jgi:hypothetical protein